MSQMNSATMTNEQLATLIQSGQTEYTLTLWNQVERFVRMKAHRWSLSWSNRGISFDDLYQSGFIAMMQAVEQFDPERGNFLTWLNFRLLTVFSDAVGVRTERSRRDPINTASSLDAPLEDDEGGTLHEVVPDMHDHIDEANQRIYQEQLHTALEHELSSLPVNEARTIHLRFFDGLSIPQVARILRITPEAARLYSRRAMTALRKNSHRSALQCFLDERTDFYNVHGVHGLERLIVHREIVTEKYFR